MTPRRHPEPELLFDYVAGALAAADTALVAAHVGLCCACRRDAVLLDEVAGVLFEDLPGVPPAPAAAARRSFS